MAGEPSAHAPPEAPQTDTRIAIIGRAGRFPDAPDVAGLWKMLCEGRHAMRRRSTSELRAAGVRRSALADPDYVRRACILPDMACFDADFFGFSPKEAAILDPQHRHFLETGWEALEDAGIVPGRFDGRIGVYAGSGMQAYLPYNLLTNPDLVEDIGLFLLRHTGNDKDFLPSRLSYLLNLTGPSVAIQTACSTSLVAVHSAIGALLNMECDLALAGGVTIELPHGHGYRYAEGEILSPDGLCRPFDDGAQGTVFGSGAAVLALRRFEDAEAAGDDIKAVILASAVNNDGAGKASYLAPSVDGQAEAAAEALALSGLAAGDIGYVEAHGTGTAIGDPIELEALAEAYGAAGVGAIGIGSLKGNIGHLDTAAGAAGLIKVVEALRKRHLPASLHVARPTSRHDFAISPFAVQAAARAWASDAPRRAAVNSLGVGGTNAHVIVEEASPRVPSVEDNAWQLCLFSARDTSALDRIPPKWATFLDHEAPAMADIAASLFEGRHAFPARMAIAAKTPSLLLHALEERTSPFKVRGHAAPEPPSVVFLFPGGGAQYPGAGAGLYTQSPAFAAAVDECFAVLPETAPSDLREMMFARGRDDPEAVAKIARSAYALPALFIIEYAYSALWKSWGVVPAAILAHSAGEYAGAVLTGALTLADALRIVVARGLVMEAAPEGAMTAVPLGGEALRAKLGGTLDIAALNGRDATVVSGNPADIAAFEHTLECEGLSPQRIAIGVAAHSRHLDGQLERFRNALSGIEFGVTSVPMVSSRRGDWCVGDDLVSADYWVGHLRDTVRFHDAVSAVLNAPDRVVVEMGPGQTLGPLVADAGVSHVPRGILASAPRPRDAADEMGVALTALGGLWAHGVEVDISRTEAPGGRRISVPTYPFAKDRHWIEPGNGMSSEAPEPTRKGLERREDLADWFSERTWTERPLQHLPPSGDW
ncbi:MAG: type I polyketide synthase, partial [Pseudomonadota bacterium]